MPGMSCTAKLVPYVKKNALTVPASAVFTDELDDEKRFVYLVGDKEGQNGELPWGRNPTVA